MTWPSFFAASMSAGVIGSGGGASAMTRVDNAAPASNAVDPLSTVRRDILGFFIGAFHPLFWRDWVHQKLSFIPTVYSESFVDSASLLQLDLITGFGNNQSNITRPGFGRLQ